jgi:indolepyruvate ferredoxin oxidoreductase beta subunit
MAFGIMIVGVGGQGTLLASRVLGDVYLSRGCDVKVSEVHGMSQRGGSVVTYVKYGDKVYSPVVDPGEADCILAFELLEAARWLPYLKKGGKLIVNRQRISPMPVITGAAAYPAEIVSKIRAKGADVLDLDALALAEKAGSAKAVNVVLLGVYAATSGIPEAEWLAALENHVKPKLLEMNKTAFRLGREAGK